MKKKQEESSLEKLSTWYQDGEQDGIDRTDKRRLSKDKEDHQHRDRTTHGSSSDSTKRKKPEDNNDGNNEVRNLKDKSHKNVSDRIDDKEKYNRSRGRDDRDRDRDRDLSNSYREREYSRRSDGVRLSNRKGDTVKAMSSGGVSNENYDVIEIQTGPKKDEEYGEDSRDEASSDYSGGRGRSQRNATPGRMQTPNRGPRPGRGGKGRGLGGGGGGGGRENQSMQMPIIGSPFANIGMPPPSPMQSLTPGMSPIPGPPGTPVFMPTFPLIWPPGGVRGLDGSLLPVPPVLSPLPPGPSGPRFPSNANMFFNPPGGTDRGGGVPNFSASPFNVPGRGMPSDKNVSGGWVHPRAGGPPGKAPSRGEQNDYSQNFLDTGMRPQNFIRELELTNVEDYPKLRELIQKKDEIVTNSASAPMYLKGDLHEVDLSPELFGTKFDVILVDPPWEEYVHRAPGVSDSMEYWTFEDIINLKIEAIADTPSFVFLWVGDGFGLEQGRQCLKKWGFRRCEDICWVKTNKSNAAPTLRHDSRTLFQRSKEHCLMGIKGTVRRSTDGHIIHANIDTDVIIAEEPPYGSTQKPEDMYRIIEHFALGRRRLELFGEDHNIRSGWLTVGKGLSSSNFDPQAYVRNFADKEGKVWLGGGGRNPPPDAPHLVVTTPDIESLRPKSPMKNQQQQSFQPSQSSANSSNRRTNTPQANPNVVVLHQEASGSNFSVPPTPQWVATPPAAAPPPPPPLLMDSFRVPEGNNNNNNTRPPEDKSFDMYGFNS